jgi:hypothetical protein
VWHTLNSAEALERLGASRTVGLTSGDARRGSRATARTASPKPRAPARGGCLFEQFQNLLVIILLVGAAISDRARP